MYSRNNPLRFIDPNGLDDITYDESGNEIERKKRYLMASYGYHEQVAKFGAGVQQMMSDLPFQGPAWHYYEDPRDQDAIGKGFGWYRWLDNVRRKNIPRQGLPKHIDTQFPVHWRE